MKTLVTPTQMAQLDAQMIQNGIPSILLMENAAFGVTSQIEKRIPIAGCVLVLCGRGNNGGDGFAIARQLRSRGYNVKIALAGSVDTLAGDAKTNALSCMCEIQDISENVQGFFEKYAHAEVLVDALFGTGLNKPVSGIYKQIIECINAHSGLKVCVDIPSGIDGGTGCVLGEAVRADITVTFAHAKLGHYLCDGLEYTGQLIVHPIGLGCADTNIFLYEDADFALPERKRNTHKGTYGTVKLIAGSEGMCGAAMLAANAAVHTGAGLTMVGTCSYVADKLQTAAPCVMAKNISLNESYMQAQENILLDFMLGATSIVLGPGLGKSSADVVKTVIQNGDMPKIVDADALNTLSENMDWLRDACGDIVLTPHPKEMSRLTGQPIQEIIENPVAVAMDLAREFGVCVLLKGAVSIATDGVHAYLLPQGSAGMAKGGSGDVLSGVIGALLAQGQGCLAAARLGAYICAKAGEHAAAQYGTYSSTPEHTIANISKVIRQC